MTQTHPETMVQRLKVTTCLCEIWYCKSVHYLLIVERYDLVTLHCELSVY